MIALLTALYVVLRCCFLYGKDRLRETFFQILRIGLHALVGLMMSAALLLPVLKVFTSSYRTGIKYNWELIYTADYYRQLASALISVVRPQKGTQFGMSAIVLPAVFFLMAGKNRKQYPKVLKALLVAGVFMLLTPAVGRVLNGFAYASNRWSWAFCMLLSYILVTVWNDFFSVTRKEFICLTAIVSAYTFFYWKDPVVQMPLALLWTWLGFAAVCVYRGFAAFGVQAFLLLLTLSGAVGNANAQFSPGGNDVADKHMTYAEVGERLLQNPDREMVRIQEKEKFFRYMGDAVQKNSAPANGTHAIQYYWSLSNGRIEQFLDELQVRVKQTYYFNGLDDRTMLTSLAGCRFYVTTKEGRASIPYGYRRIGEDERYLYYENEYALPLAYTYSSYITHDQLKGLNGAQKEEAMMKSVVLEQDIGGGCQKSMPDLDGELLEHCTLQSSNVEWRKKGLGIVGKPASLTLQIQGKKNAETYLCLTGYRYLGNAPQVTVTINGKRRSGVIQSKELYHASKKFERPSVIRNFVIDLGYSEEEITEVELTFFNRGMFLLKNLFFWSQPLDFYAKEIAARKADVWEDETIGTDRVSGRIDLKKDKLLCLTIPYDGGWTAYVDGERQELLQANLMYSALALSAGEHRIELVYHTPGLRAGTWISMAGLLIFIGIIRKRRERNAA